MSWSKRSWNLGTDETTNVDVLGGGGMKPRIWTFVGDKNSNMVMCTKIASQSKSGQNVEELIVLYFYCR